MKIESKHGTKKPVYALGVALLASTTLLTGCPLFYAGGMDLPTDPYQSTPTTEVQIEGELDGFIDDPTTTTVIGDPIMGVFGAATGTYADFNLGRLGNQYTMLMNKIDEIEATAPGEFKYNITAVRDRDYDRYFFILSSTSSTTE